jgi:hypothetical protein
MFRNLVVSSSYWDSLVESPQVFFGVMTPSRPLKFVPTARGMRSSRGSMAIGLADVDSSFDLFADHGHAPSNLGSRMRL